MCAPLRSQLPPHTSLAPSSPRLRVNQISRSVFKQELKINFLRQCLKSSTQTNKHNVFRTLSWWTALTWTWTPNEVVVVVSFCCRALILSYCDAKTWPKIPRALNLSSSVIGNSCSQILVFHVPLLFEQIKFYI